MNMGAGQRPPVPDSLLVKLHLQGLNYKQIGKQVNRSGTRVGERLRALGFVKNRKNVYKPAVPLRANVNVRDDETSLLAVYRRTMGLSVEAMAQKCNVSPGLLRMLEAGEVTSPSIARRVAEQYCLTELQYEELIPLNYREHGGAYDPGKYSALSVIKKRKPGVTSTAAGKREYERKRRKALWDKRSAAGLCPKCGGEIDDKKYKQCSACRAKEAERMRRRRNECLT